MTKRKAQMEIMGLAIVLILVTLVFLFVVQMTGKDESDAQISFSEAQLAANMVSSILDTTTKDCYGQQVKTLVQNCFGANDVVCENGQRSCEYANDTISELLNETLYDMRRSFKFQICQWDFFSAECHEGRKQIIFENRDCTDDKLPRSKSIPFKSGSIQLNANMMICVR